MSGTEHLRAAMAQLEATRESMTDQRDEMQVLIDGLTERICELKLTLRILGDEVS